jgi:transcription antitermination factor NusG
MHVAGTIGSAREAEAKGGEALTPVAQSLPWLVVWTHSNYEQRVHDQLNAKQFHVFLPKIETWTRRGGTRSRARIPMFPGYLFVRRAMDKASYVAMCQVPGVVRVLGDRWDQLATVPEGDIDAIQRLAASRLAVAPHPYLREGQRVRIKTGPLADVHGILLRDNVNKGVLVISVEMLRRSVAVEVDVTLVEAA